MLILCLSLFYCRSCLSILEKLNYKTHFRLATGNGVADVHPSSIAVYELEVTLIRTGLGPRSCGTNKWIGNKLPQINFVSMYRRDPAFKPDIVYDGAIFLAGLTGCARILC